jgi:hypothetical protein
MRRRPGLAAAGWSSWPGNSKAPVVDGGFLGANLRWADSSPGQWKESPQAQEPVAFGLSIVKPCFSMLSTKSIIAPLR